MLTIGVVIVAAVSVGLALQRRGGNEATAATGNVASCLQLKGDVARACYSREVGKQLAAAGSAPRAVFVAAADPGATTFVSDDAQGAELLCPLHTRVGVTDENRPSWVSWTEPPVT